MMERWLFIVLALIFVVGCATPPAYDPYRIPKSQVHSWVKTIALSPVSLPRVAGKAEGVKGRIESLIATKLGEAGYAVISSKEFGAIWDRFVEQTGGFYDPVTGKADEGKIKTVREHARREIVTRFNVDALLHPSVQVVGARLKGFQAIWDGVSEDIKADDWYQSFEEGTTKALSLTIVIEDRNGVDLYISRGGIQLISKTVRGRFVDIQASEILTNEEKIIEAVNIALKQFFEKIETPGKSP
jgi:hypothetical protein